jgi:uncharacterized protein (TIGR03083 family)
MADESLLDGLDPFDLLDRESDRVHLLFTSSPDWSRPSRCAGWSTRDMLGHLTGLEDYTRAGLDGRVRDLFRAGKAAGATGVAGFNDWQIRQYDDLPAADLVEQWRAAVLANRAELRARGRDGSIDTSIGAYPSWLQTFHFAVEYATHGDDIGVVVDDADRSDRLAWRVAFGRFVLTELEKPVEVTPDGDVLRVSGEPGTTVLDTTVLDAHDFVEATQGRLPDGHPLDAAFRELLSTVP